MVRSAGPVKRVGAGLVVLLLLVVVGDRVAASYAGRVIATEVQRAAALDTPPDVEITGFPFLTQALSGRYDRVVARAADVPADDRVVVDELVVVLRGARVPASDLLSQSVQVIPVDRLTARALVSYDELTRASGDRGLVVTPDGDRLQVTAELEVGGQTLSAVARSRVDVDDGALLLSAEEVGVGTGAGEVGSTSALTEALELRVPVPGLPYGLVITSAEVRPDGVQLAAESEDVVLEAGPAAS